MMYFQEEFPCIAVTDDKKRISTIITLTSILNEIFDLTLTMRDTENIICKAFRAGVRNTTEAVAKSFRKKQTSHFRDVIFPNQCVIDFRHNGFKVGTFQCQKL
eukprot:scaffold89565_cov27-Attheya_sp.AAC.2